MVLTSYKGKVWKNRAPKMARSSGERAFRMASLKELSSWKDSPLSFISHFTFSSVVWRLRGRAFLPLVMHVFEQILLSINFA